MAVLPLLANYDQDFLPFYLTTDSSAWIQTINLRINSTLFYNCTRAAGHPCLNLFAIFFLLIPVAGFKPLILGL
jgi:hypothetical protein